MAGLIPHLIAGSLLYLIGRYSFQHYFETNQKTKRKLTLAGMCLGLSIFPDVFLGAYYTVHLLSYKTLIPYHEFTHYVLIPFAILVLLLLIFIIDQKRKPLWIMGLCALVLHVIMDVLLQEADLFL
jgi:membrane-bound metal-dependent hydrolase YbcI (DUF457 family)